MNTQQLTRVLSSDAFTTDVFKDVLPRNHLPSVDTLRDHPRPVGWVLNTDPCQGGGEHWVALYIGADGVGEYFDSYGISPMHPDVVSRLNGSLRIWAWNTRPLQSLETAVCGQYCVFYALHRVRGLTMTDIVHMFDDSPLDNDARVYDFVYDHFNVYAPYWASPMLAGYR